MGYSVLFVKIMLFKPIETHLFSSTSMQIIIFHLDWTIPGATCLLWTGVPTEDLQGTILWPSLAPSYPTTFTLHRQFKRKSWVWPASKYPLSLLPGSLCLA